MNDTTSQLFSSPPALERIFPDLRIEPLRQQDLDAAQAHLDDLTKPRGSLGRLEDLARRLYAMHGGQVPLRVHPALMLTVAGDHGVAAQGVSPFPQAVTRQMVQNFFGGGAAINVLCRSMGMELRVVDAGCAGGPFAPNPMLLDCRLGAHIAPEGFIAWNDRTDTGLASFAEADSTGPGAAERPAWVKQLSGPEAAELLARARTLCRPKTN